jgi:serine acetyltransferase
LEAPIIIVKSGASICSHVTVLPGRVIGARAMVAAGSVVRSDVPDDCLYLPDGTIIPIDPDKVHNRTPMAGLR